MVSHVTAIQNHKDKSSTGNLMSQRIDFIPDGGRKSWNVTAKWKLRWISTWNYASGGHIFEAESGLKRFLFPKPKFTIDNKWNFIWVVVCTQRLGTVCVRKNVHHDGVEGAYEIILAKDIFSPEMLQFEFTWYKRISLLQAKKLIEKKQTMRGSWIYS